MGIATKIIIFVAIPIIKLYLIKGQESSV